MKTLAEIRAAYPQYDMVDDARLTDALHAKFYSSMPIEQFRTEVQKNEARSNIAKENAELAKPAEGDMNFAQKFAVGAATPVAELGYGIKQAVAGLTPQQETQLRGVRDARQDAGAVGTAGEIASFAIPGTAAVKGAAMATKAMPAAAKIAGLAGSQAALQGGYEGARASLDGDPSRLDRAGTGAAYGAIGSLAGAAIPAVASKMLSPFAQTAPAAAIAKEGVSQGVDLGLTIGQSGGKTAKGIEDALTAVPFVGAAIRRGQEAAVANWNLKVLREAARPLQRIGVKADVAEPGNAGIAAVQDAVAKGYASATDGVVVKMADNGPFAGVWAGVRKRLANDDAKKVGGILKNLADDIKQGKVKGGVIKETEAELRAAASAAYKQGNREMGKALDETRKVFRSLAESNMTRQQRVTLRAADNAYKRLASINEAASSQAAQARGGLFTPADLVRGQGSRLSKSAKAGGKIPGRAGALEANAILGNTLPTPGPGTAEKLATVGMASAAGGALQAGGEFVKNGETDFPVLGAVTPVMAALMFGKRSPRNDKLARILMEYGVAPAAAIGGTAGERK